MLAIGTHCEFCGARDFLPFTCSKCDKSFCGAHREFHNCQPLVKPASTKPPPKPAQQPLTKTALLPRTPPPAAARPSDQKPKPLPSTNTAAKKTALDRLRSLIGGKNSTGAAASPKPSSEPPLHKTAVGDSKVPENRRVYLRIRRPAQNYLDTITNTEQKRAAKIMALYYDRDTPVGRVIDMASVNLGLKGTKLMLGSEPLGASVPIGKFAGKTLDIS
ncbi:CDC48-associated ubiquitin-like/zinc finger protein 1 [Wickerhamiella sorbophila]|uniref:CDC48-associated ubiquitin-like/zinc finger protein 1 n=1 Tax=Wickerhamiella sorbophila TaxID=45607 RepID=A0A2T0FFX6_9ASCO|nr:CDC48-associated ubiquitin-like/zinc finger protein 1 [Wickerhamiella sorbophila]PRT53891.1 CDC48-associated ubiquitin-like/zinc finger protein 1 [Wickerhamiella sorbophila]